MIKIEIVSVPNDVEIKSILNCSVDYVKLYELTYDEFNCDCFIDVNNKMILIKNKNNEIIFKIRGRYISYNENCDSIINLMIYI